MRASVAHATAAAGALRPLLGGARADLDLAERLVLRPRRLALLVQLQQREQRHADGHAVGAADGVLERRPARGRAQQAAQVREAVGDRHARDRQVPDVDPRRHRQQRPDRPAQARGPVDALEVLDVGRAQVRGQRRAAEADAVLAVQLLDQVQRRAAVALGLEHPGEQLLGRDVGLDVEQLLVLAREHQARLQLQQRGDQHQELGRDLQVQLAAGLQDVDVRQHDVGQLHLQQVDLLAEDERQQEVERTGEDLEVELQLGDDRAHTLGTVAAGPDGQGPKGRKERRSALSSPGRACAGRRPSPRARPPATSRVIARAFSAPGGEDRLQRVLVRPDLGVAGPDRLEQLVDRVGRRHLEVAVAARVGQRGDRLVRRDPARRGEDVDQVGDAGLRRGPWRSAAGRRSRSPRA